MTEPSLNSIVLAPGVTVERDALRFVYARSSGPGGQSVNKVNTQAQLRVAVGDLRGLDEEAEERLRTLAGRRLTNDDEIVIQASSSRSQSMNRQLCIERLQTLVEAAVRRPKIRKRSKPSRAAKRRRLEAKREHKEKKQRRRWREE